MVGGYGQAADPTDDLQWLLGGAEQWELLDWFPRHVALNTRDGSITVAHTDTEGEKKDTKLLLQPPISAERNGETDLELVLLARAGAGDVRVHLYFHEGEDADAVEAHAAQTLEQQGGELRHRSITREVTVSVGDELEIFSNSSGEWVASQVVQVIDDEDPDPNEHVIKVQYTTQDGRVMRKNVLIKDTQQHREPGPRPEPEPEPEWRDVPPAQMRSQPPSPTGRNQSRTSSPPQQQTTPDHPRPRQSRQPRQPPARPQARRKA